MSFIWVAALIIFLAEQGFEYALDVLNLRHMKKFQNVPDEFTGILDDETFRKTRGYESDKTAFGITEGVFGDVILLAFLFFGILDWYNNTIFTLHLHFVLSGILFFLILTTAQTFLNIPFDLYGTFRIEKKYGFNTMKPGLWVSDFLKSLLIQTILSGALIGAGLWVVQSSPHWWWLWLWLFYFLFSLFMMVISPYVIEPLFNKYTPLEDEALVEKIKAMLSKTGIQINRVFKMDASKRSRHSNAYFTGIGKVKRIVLFDTLLSQFTHEEILSVLAHEAGHWKKHHVMKRLAATEILSLGVFFVTFLIIKSEILNQAFSIQYPTFFTNVLLAGFILGLLSFLFSPVAAFFSRRDEREADRYAVELMGEGDSMISSLKKLVKDNLSNLFPHPLVVLIHYSHPPVMDRIGAIRKLGNKSTENTVN